jgi:hypothetical protein
MPLLKQDAPDLEVEFDGGYFTKAEELLNSQRYGDVREKPPFEDPEGAGRTKPTVDTPSRPTFKVIPLAWSLLRPRLFTQQFCVPESSFTCNLSDGPLVRPNHPLSTR